MNPYNPDKWPRSYNGAQALINHLTTHDTITRMDATQLITDTGLAPKSADNIILKLNGKHIITIKGRTHGPGDKRTNHTIQRGTRWDPEA